MAADFSTLRSATIIVSARIRGEANRRDVPYQSYLKMLLADALDQR